MRKTVLLILIVLCFAVFAMAQTAILSPPSSRIIVKFKSGSQSLAAARAASPRAEAESADLAEPRHAALASALGGSGLARIRAMKPDAGLQPLAGGMERLFVVDLAAGVAPADAIRALSSNPDVEYAEPDYVARATGTPIKPQQQAAGGPPGFNLVTPNDPFFSSQWALQNTGQTIPLTSGGNLPIKAGADINATAAWTITTGSSSVILAVLDSGINMTHPEFAGRLVDGWNYIDTTKGKDVTDDHGHGTGMAGVAAATGNNGTLVAGVDWNCKIMPVKVIDKTGSAPYDIVISGMRFAADNGANVINLSLGGYDDSSAMRDAVSYANSKGAILVAGMGNDNRSDPLYPASIPNVIAVGATNAQDLRAVPMVCGEAGSNYGNNISFVAPGDYLYGLDYQHPTGVLVWCGTSVAAPMVSGTVTLMLAINPKLNFDQVFAALKAGARDQVGPAAEDTQGWDRYFGWGRIDAYRSLLYARGTSLFSHVAVGGGWTTVFTFVNTGSADVTGNLILTKNDGTALNASLSEPSVLPNAAPSAGQNAASSLSITIPKGGVRFVTATGSGSGSDTGWARLDTSGGLVGGVGTFQYSPGGSLKTLAGVLSSSTVQYATIPVDNNLAQRRDTGYAVANIGSDPISIKIIVVDQGGNVVAPNPPISNMVLQPGQQNARFLSQDSLATLGTFQGSVVLIEKDGKRFSVVALVANADLYTAIPVIPSKPPNIN